MARTRTLADLCTECWERSETTETYIPTAEMYRMVNGSLAELYDLICSVNKSLLMNSTPQSVSVVSGTNVYAVAADYYRTVGVDVLDGSTYYPLQRFNWHERNSSSSSSKTTTLYRVAGSRIWLTPTPNWSGTIRHWYIPAPPVLTVGGSWDGVAGWEEYIITDVVEKIRAKAGEDASLEAARKADLWKRIQAAAADTDDNEPQRVRDVDMETADRYAD